MIHGETSRGYEDIKNIKTTLLYKKYELSFLCIEGFVKYFGII